MNTNKKGFSLGEVLTTLALLGVVAAISIPSLSVGYQKRVAKTKIKSAMVTFDSLIRQVAVDVGRAPTNSTILTKIKGADDKCSNITKYMKAVNRTNCTVTTPDGVFWNFADTSSGENGIFVKVAVNQAALNAITSKTTNYNNGAWFYAIQTPSGLYINNEAAKTNAPDSVKTDVSSIISRLEHFTD